MQHYHQLVSGPQNSSHLPVFCKATKTESNVKAPQGSAISLPADTVRSTNFHLPAIPSQNSSHLPVVYNAIKAASDATLRQKSARL